MAATQAKPGPAARGPSEAQRRRLLADCRVTYYRASGPGGQHRNKTSSAVRLRHLPTGLIVTCAQTRSQHRNRVLALERLWRRLRARARKPKPRRRTKVTAAARTRRLTEKKSHGRKKALRRKPSPED